VCATVRLCLGSRVMSSAQGHRAQQGALRRPGGVKPQRSSHDTFRPHRQPFKRRLTEGHHLEGATRHKGGGSHEQCILILEIRTLGAENLIWPIMMQSEPPPRGGHTALGTSMYWERVCKTMSRSRILL
jgi:hypothetical protein